MSHDRTYLQHARDRDVADLLATFARSDVSPALVEQIGVALSLVFAEGAMAAFTTMTKGHTLRELRDHITTLLNEAAARSRANREKHASSTTQESRVRTVRTVRTDLADVPAGDRRSLADAPAPSGDAATTEPSR